MPSKKPEETKTPETEPAKAGVRKRGINDAPTPTTPSEGETNNGRTMP